MKGKNRILIKILQGEGGVGGGYGSELIRCGVRSLRMGLQKECDVRESRYLVLIWNRDQSFR